MKTLSIRGVDEELAVQLEKIAATEHKSVNRVVLEALRNHLGVTNRERFSRNWADLDALFGLWSDQDYSRIQGKIDAERRIDAELWP